MPSRGVFIAVAAGLLFFITFLASIVYSPAVVVREVSQASTESSSIGTKSRSRKGSSPTVLFVVNTHEKNYKTRVRDIRSTYLPRIHQKSSLDLIFVSSQMTDGSPDMFQTTCPMGYREDSCKRADMVTIAGGYLRRPENSVFDWIFFIDDDAFILPDNVQRVIMEGIKKEKNLTAVFAISGCVHDKCGGICGGGGYYMNRDTLFHVLNSGNKTLFPSIREETDFYDAQCGRCGDLTIARAIVDFHSVPVKPYPTGGIYVWGIDGKNTDSDFIRSLRMKNPLPWLYHYPARDRFPQFQKWVDEYGSNKELAD